MESLLKALGGRKLVLALILLGSGIAVDIFSQKGLTSNMLYLFGLLYGSFTVGNAGEHFNITKREAIKADTIKIKTGRGKEDKPLDLSALDAIPALTNQIANMDKTHGDALAYLVSVTNKYANPGK